MKTKPKRLALSKYDDMDPVDDKLTVIWIPLPSDFPIQCDLDVLNWWFPDETDPNSKPFDLAQAVTGLTLAEGCKTMGHAIIDRVKVMANGDLENEHAEKQRE